MLFARMDLCNDSGGSLLKSTEQSPKISDDQAVEFGGTVRREAQIPPTIANVA